MKLVIVDYQLGNLFSVKQACINLGFPAELTCDPDILHQADAVILPGVGAFAEAMSTLKKDGMDQALVDFVKTGKPFFGVCLGMQLLLTASVEFDEARGLGIEEGVIRRIPAQGRKVPQIGWNQIHPALGGGQDWSKTPLRDVKHGDYMYFVHSYYCAPAHPGVELCRTNYYGFDYCSALVRDNVFATQFHPEKSGPAGLSIYENWLKAI